MKDILRSKELRTLAAAVVIGLGATACTSTPETSKNSNDAEMTPHLTKNEKLAWPLPGYKVVGMVSQPTHNRLDFHVTGDTPGRPFNNSVSCNGRFIEISGDLMGGASPSDFSIEDPVCSDGVMNQNDWPSVVNTLHLVDQRP